MFGKKKAPVAPVVEEKKEKPTPAYLRDDYPYKAIGEPITDLDSLVQTGVLYEIKCPKCEMSIRSQGSSIFRSVRFSTTATSASFPGRVR